MGIKIKEIHPHEIVIIGGGLAGLRAAYEASLSSDDVVVISKVHPLRSHSVAAQGGVNAALGNTQEGEDDSWENHAYDTVKASDYLADQDAVNVLCEDAPSAIYEMEHMGCVFSRLPSGKIAQRPFGGAGFPRTCYAADRTGHNMLNTLYEQVVARNVKFYNEFYVTSLAVNEDRCMGACAIDISDMSLHGFSTKALLIATGGYGRLYDRSTNALINSGDGAALALKAGCPLKDMEFVQFHPTTLYGTNILITEGARGEGGLLMNSKGERFMKNYASSAMELAPRDIVARAIQKEVNEGRGIENEYVNLDLTHLGKDKIIARLPGIRQIAMDFAGVDPVEKPIPVQPGQHYSMGGIDCDRDCRTAVPGLYAAGEAACISVHGANRLGGNSLLETLVFGKIAVRSILRDIRNREFSSTTKIMQMMESEEEKIEDMVKREEGESMHPLIKELRNTLYENFGIFRTENTMAEGLIKIRELRDRFKGIKVGAWTENFNYSIVQALELESMLLISEPLALGALHRRESRGSHYRTDYPKRDDDGYLAHTICHLSDGKLLMEYQPVTLGTFPIKERVY